MNDLARFLGWSADEDLPALLWLAYSMPCLFRDHVWLAKHRSSLLGEWRRIWWHGHKEHLMSELLVTAASATAAGVLGESIGSAVLFGTLAILALAAGHAIKAAWTTRKCVRHVYSRVRDRLRNLLLRADLIMHNPGYHCRLDDARGWAAEVERFLARYYPDELPATSLARTLPEGREDVRTHPEVIRVIGEQAVALSSLRVTRPKPTPFDRAA